MNSPAQGPGVGPVVADPESAHQLKKPDLFQVVLHNDDYTTMEFVVMVLTDVFRHSEAQAVSIMLHVHKHGRGVAGVYTYEIAETKAQRVVHLARQYEFPLRCTVEPTQ